ncbi:putative MFS monocarboxylate transporter [Pleomassaria siparia CBS 279.74]|uniref:Putative MFS monocarboxylate transporter n=1 Tax=Pleomassaria siparia CBS 279.74 TaxID=1314801 RepID=A0A6G1JT74_9PLEO|nr:putative MFS monocarboxylate transporter [Pleomassaria siparia CBS 279.74]
MSSPAKSASTSLDDTREKYLPSAAPTNQDTEKNAADHSAPTNPWDPSAFPDGGAEAWLVVLGCFCALFVSFGWIGAIGVFQEYYQLHQLKDYTPSQVSWIPAVEATVMFLGGSWVGRIQDLYGPRYLIYGGTFLHPFGLMMASLSTKYWHFILSQGIVSSIGASMVFYPSFACLATYFMKKRAAAFGLSAVGSSLGGILFPIMVIHLVEDIGYAWTMRACAFMIFGLLCISCFTIKSRIPPAKTPVKFMDFVKPLSELPFLLMTASMFFLFLGLFVPFIFISVEATVNGMSPLNSIYLVAVMNATSIVGRTLPAPLADKYGRFNVLIIMSWLTTLFTLAIWIPANTEAKRWVFSSFFGVSSGTLVSMSPALVAQISDVRQIGVRTGTMYTFVAIAVLIGNPVASSLVTDHHTNYRNLKIFAGCAMAIGSVLLMASRIAISGFKLKAKV